MATIRIGEFFFSGTEMGGTLTGGGANGSLVIVGGFCVSIGVAVSWGTAGGANDGSSGIGERGSVGVGIGSVLKF
jgi:hypothetical protein